MKQIGGGLKIAVIEEHLQVGDHLVDRLLLGWRRFMC